MIELIGLVIVVIGMWGSFYLGSRREHEKIFEGGRNLVPESMDIPDEVTEEEYQKALKDHNWSISDEREDTESETG
jgi:hypothetical protein